MVTEAGGLVGNFTGEADFLYQREVVAGNPKIYAQLVSRLAPYTQAIEAPRRLRLPAEKPPRPRWPPRPRQADRLVQPCVSARSTPVDQVSETIEPFTLAISDEVLADLRSRLARTRWPERETVGDWSQGVPLDRIKALCDYWARDYDWRRCEARLNALGQYRTRIDGLRIHFLHVRSRNPDAVPLILTHGWPGSVVEFLDVIGPLTDPAAHGGDAADAFHVVVPSLPGFGFSDKPTTTGWGVERIAAAWIELDEAARLWTLRCPRGRLGRRHHHRDRHARPSRMCRGSSQHAADLSGKG